MYFLVIPDKTLQNLKVAVLNFTYSVCAVICSQKKRGDINLQQSHKWYGIVEFNVPLDTLYVISETGPAVT